MNKIKMFDSSELQELKAILLGDWKSAQGVVCLSSGEEFHLDDPQELHGTIITLCNVVGNSYDVVAVETFKSALESAEIVSLSDGGLAEEDCDVFMEY